MSLWSVFNVNPEFAYLSVSKPCISWVLFVKKRWLTASLGVIQHIPQSPSLCYVSRDCPSIPPPLGTVAQASSSQDDLLSASAWLLPVPQIGGSDSSAERCSRGLSRSVRIGCKFPMQFVPSVVNVCQSQSSDSIDYQFQGRVLSTSMPSSISGTVLVVRLMWWYPRNQEFLTDTLPEEPKQTTEHHQANLAELPSNIAFSKEGSKEFQILCEFKVGKISLALLKLLFVR